MGGAMYSWVTKPISFVLAIAVNVALYIPAEAGPMASQFEGKWSDDGNCTKAVQITVFEDRIQFAWPDFTVVEKIVSETEAHIETVILSDTRTDGEMNHKYRYTV